MRIDEMTKEEIAKHLIANHGSNGVIAVLEETYEYVEALGGWIGFGVHVTASEKASKFLKETMGGVFGRRFCEKVGII